MARRPSAAFFLSLVLCLPAAALRGAPDSQRPTLETLNALFDGARAARPAAAVAPRSDLDSWLGRERGIALQRMLANVSPPGAAPGSVAASPSRSNPDYWFNWKRDAALTMNEIVALYRAATAPAQKQAWFKLLRDYADFARRAQTAPSQSGLGEPKHNMDGSVFTGPWGRPQDDGPAEEASTLIAFARSLLAEGRKDLALKLYGDFASGIKGDLEYVSHHWSQTSFDVWEEVKARHFDTAVAQREALLQGAGLARALGDPRAAAWYESQAGLIAAELGRHWDASKGYLVSAIGRDGGLDYKASGLDSAVILAAIHREPGGDPAFSVTDPRILATAWALKQSFRTGYALNRRADAPGVAIGRYPEDRYFGGNPWVLSTNAFAELHYKAASEYLRRGALTIESASLAFFQDIVADTPLKAPTTVRAGEPLFDRVVAGLREGGDSYLRVVRAHANPDGSLSEQIDKDSGYMTSARDLTWNYASFLSALRARRAVVAALKTASIDAMMRATMGLWAAWLFYWWLAGRSVEKAEKTESLLSRALHLGILACAFLFLFSDQLRVGFMGRRIIPEALFIEAVGLGLTTAGLLLCVWARVHLGRFWSGEVQLKEGHRLIASGPYAFVRHPIYTGFLLAVCGSAVTLGEVRGLLILAATIAAYARKIRLEEELLNSRFGAEYDQYERRTWALLPFVL
ncbi:MAG: hypothetical protein HY077_18260 [Elusimicrobia bacterium]|nr:hypothetical protein [Elusimicrobiota bacterium]